MLPEAGIIYQDALNRNTIAPTGGTVEKPAITTLLTWEDSYAIALALMRLHPNVNLEDVSLHMIYTWTVALAEFKDDRELANDQILSAIYQEWFEEANSV